MNFVQLECRERVLNRVVCVRLDVLLQDEPSQETQRQSSLAVLEVVQVDGVDDLFWRDEDVWNMDRIKYKSMTGTAFNHRYALMIRKSFDSPCPMKMHPLSTSRRSFLYTTLSGVNVYLDKVGSKSPSVVAPLASSLDHLNASDKTEAHI